MRSLVSVLVWVWAVPATALQPDSGASTTPNPPNFIFILTDDQRWDALGCVQDEQGSEARFPWFETPNMDRLAAEGARFRNAFVVHSLCSPSRASFLSGQQTYQHNVRHNWQPLRPQLDTWAHRLQGAGYHTAYFGKWHMGQQRKRPGFETVFSYLGQGRYNDWDFISNGKKVSTTGWIDDVSTDRAIDFLSREHDSPFAMVIGYKSPHEPRVPPERRANDYADVRLVKPASHELIPPFRPEGFVPLDFDSRMEDRRNYFRCVAAIDDCVGRILGALDAQGLAEDTVLIFAGDNGYYLGEHADHDKRTAYEESLRIPLLIRYPREIAPDTLIDYTTLNIDVAPTILEFAGLPIPELAGHSLVAALRDPGSVEGKERAFLYENYQDPEFPEHTFDILALRTDEHKLITYPNHPEWSELFDLIADPQELRDLFQRADFAEHRDRLVRQLEDLLVAAGLTPVLTSD